MIPFLVCFGAFVIVLLFVQNGMRTGAFPALCGMLSGVLGLFIALRYWFLATRWLSERETLPVPLLAIATFWTIFIVALFILSKVRQNLAVPYESVNPSFVDRVLGAGFGLVAGMAVMTALMMTLSILSPKFWPAYKASELPLPLDRWPLEAYRFVETRAARVDPTEPGHTPLPLLKETYLEKPAEFWQ